MEEPRIRESRAERSSYYDRTRRGEWSIGRGESSEEETDDKPESTNNTHKKLDNDEQLISWLNTREQTESPKSLRQETLQEDLNGGFDCQREWVEKWIREVPPEPFSSEDIAQMRKASRHPDYPPRPSRYLGADLPISNEGRNRANRKSPPTLPTIPNSEGYFSKPPSNDCSTCQSPDLMTPFSSYHECAEKFAQMMGYAFEMGRMSARASERIAEA